MMKLCTTYRCVKCNYFSGDTLCHSVTLTFDLSILNYYNISGVVCLNYEQHLSEIE